MDPFSVTVGAVALMGVCVTVAHGIKAFIEKTKMSKPMLIKLLERVEHVRLYLAQLRSVAARLTDPEHKSILVPFNRDACETTMAKLKALVSKIGRAGDAGTIKVTVSWMQNKRVVDELVKELEDHQMNISHTLLALAAHSSVATQSSVEQLVSRIDDMSVTSNPFQEPQALTESRPGANPAPGYTATILQMWPAQIARDDYLPDYLFQRDDLANSAYMGQWDQVFRQIEAGRTQYFEAWMNAARLKPSASLDRITLWNPLHQAAFQGASPEIVRRMVNGGAFRTLRTSIISQDDPLSYPDMTAVEIARQMGYQDLLDILSPVIRHCLPADTLRNLQQQFHTLLKFLISSESLLSQLRLPELVVLTELENPVMWFPVYFGGVRIWTFQYYLDGRELLVLGANHAQSPELQSFRLSQRDTIAIEEPLATNTTSLTDLYK